MSKIKILILGGTSFVGRHLFKYLGKDHAVATFFSKKLDNGIFFDSLSSDLSRILEDLGPFSHAVILLGDTNPETCAEDIRKSNALNVTSMKSIIKCLNNYEVKPVFTSSEFVFNGTKGNYVEENATKPILIYGKQKMEIENYIQNTCDQYVIVRLSKVFGFEKGDGTIFTNWLTAIDKNQKILCANDQIFSPVYINDVVKSIVRLIHYDCNGVYHISGNKSFNRLDLFKMVIGYVKDYSDIKINMVECSIHDFHLKEKRPLNISMKPDKLIKTIGIKLHDTDKVCRDIVRNHFKT